jgi:hypothetical protein
MRKSGQHQEDFQAEHTSGAAANEDKTEKRRKLNLGLWPTRARNIQTEPNKEERPAAAATNAQILVRKERLSRRPDLMHRPKEKLRWVRKSKVQLTNLSQGNLVSVNEV